MNRADELELLAVLDCAVFERTGVDSFQLWGKGPTWLRSLRSAERYRGSLTDAFPFLEVFLPDAEAFWANPEHQPAPRSDFWTQAGAEGKELHLCATAVVLKEAGAVAWRLLLVESAEQRFRQAQASVQHAHEIALAYNAIAKLSRELERATQAKSEFLARMSHEIRTPLNALLGMADLLWETQLTPEQMKYVRVFRSAGDNLLSVINDILDFSKVEAGQVELENIKFDLADTVQGAIDVAAVRARAKGLELDCRIRPEVPAQLVGDPSRLRQVLINLLGNATKFTDRGAITVVVEPAPDQQARGVLHFAVSDTGVGIPADRIATIFDSFTQADPSTARKYGGSGLGLAISKRFVELMGGRIWAESMPGVGSTIHFIARFTVAGAGVGPEGVSGKPASQESTPATLIPGLRILLADDSEDNRFLIREYLKGSGCLIDEVGDGALAVEKFKRGAYDLVLTDAEMPVLDGYSATRQMRAHEMEQGRPQTPILALTAHAFQEAKQRSFDAGCTDHLTKPIAKMALLDAISHYVPEPSAAGRIQVSVEPWLKPVIAGYLEKRRSDVAKLRSALDEGDYAIIRMLGHQLAGSGAGYGLEPITDIGRALEESALVGDAAQMRERIDGLDRYLNNIEVSAALILSPP
jgi:signal transduction histidine kinase/DNA-binding response OmpR family regulator